MLEQWFTTPIYYSLVDNIDSIQDEIGSVINQINFSKKLEWGSKNHSLSDPTFSENIISKYDMFNFENELMSHIEKLISETTGKVGVKSRVFSSWVTNTKYGEYTTVHNHAGADISGVYYYKTNQHDGDIYFMNPNLASQQTPWFGRLDSINHSPSVGKILLFPSWLLHGVRTNETGDERISLAFNLKVDWI